MRICLVTPYFPSSSVSDYNEGSFLLNEAKQLMKLGHEFVVVTCRHSGLPNYEIVQGIPVYRVSSFLVPRIRYPVPNLLKLVSTVLEVLKKYQIQLLDFWDQSYLTSLPVLFLKKIIKAPTTVTVGGLPGINWFYGVRIVDLVGLVHSLTLAKLIFTQADGIRSEFFSMSRILSELGIPKSKIHTVKRGVDVESFHPIENRKSKRAELGIKNDSVVVLYSGRFEKVKGLEFLIEAARQLVKEYNYLMFMFVGDGTLRRRYEEMAQSISENVMFLGFRHDVCQLMNAADLFVLPSRSESAAISVLEANACGLPVIASRVGGIPEIIRDGVNGICVTPKNISELTKALRELITNPALAKKMGENGWFSVNQQSSLETIASDVEKYYQWLVSSYTE